MFTEQDSVCYVKVEWIFFWICLEMWTLIYAVAFKSAKEAVCEMFRFCFVKDLNVFLFSC